MSQLGEQIAVLDGLAALDPSDGRISQQRARVDQYARPVMPGVMSRTGVLDASAGANYSGGSTHAPGLPLMPSSVGLANIPSVLPTRRGVIDPSGGANYSGGADWVPGMPLVSSSSGLAASVIRGGYGRAGLGAAMIRGGYGRAGLGITNSAMDEDLAGAAEAVELGRMLDPSDGRLGQDRARVDEHGRPVMPGVLERSNVIDASVGANYSGGSAYAAGLPLMPSSVGLAGLGDADEDAYDELDGLDDLSFGWAFRRAAAKAAGHAVSNQAANGLWKRMKKVVGSGKLATTKGRIIRARRKAAAAKKPVARAKAMQVVSSGRARLAKIRQARRSIMQHGGVGPNFAIHAPLWAR